MSRKTLAALRRVTSITAKLIDRAKAAFGRVVSAVRGAFAVPSFAPTFA